MVDTGQAGARHRTRDHLLDAAERITRRDGSARLTLDAVAREAEVSKGGLLYHFPSKQALVEGLVERLGQRFDSDVSRRARVSGSGPGSWTRAFVEATVEVADADVTTGVGLLAAVGTDPALLEPLRRQWAAWQARIEEDGLAPALATMVRLAADGLWLADLVGLAPPGSELRRDVRRALLAVVDQAAAEAATAPSAAGARA